ncbi:16545_t:CDS:2, partial [Funneliformis geosporum]
MLSYTKPYGIYCIEKQSNESNNENNIDNKENDLSSAIGEASSEIRQIIIETGIADANIDMDQTGPDRPYSCLRFFYVQNFLSALMLAISLVNSDQKIFNISSCHNCSVDTILDMDFRTSCVCQKSPEQ